MRLGFLDLLVYHTQLIEAFQKLSCRPASGTCIPQSSSSSQRRYPTLRDPSVRMTARVCCGLNTRPCSSMLQEAPRNHEDGQQTQASCSEAKRIIFFLFARSSIIFLLFGRGSSGGLGLFLLPGGCACFIGFFNRKYFFKRPSGN